jgi:acyl-coenzyme A synthetase/AMP-(fatty) acid ligase
MVTEEVVVTYGMLREGIERCARHIARLGLSAGTRVAITVASPIRQMTLGLALFRCGIPSIAVERGQAGFLALPLVELGDASGSVLGGGRRFVAVTDDWFATDPGGALPEGFTSPQEICRLCLTSGSTGLPKIFELSVADISRLADGFQGFNWNSLLCLPGLSSSYGFTTACTTLATGRTVCFSASPFQSVRMIELFGIDFVMAATEQLLALTRAARSSGASLKSLRTVEIAGAVPSRALLEGALTHVCKDIQCRYGATETGLMARAPAREVLARRGYAGRVLPGVEIAILDGTGKPCPPGAIGHIRSRPDPAWALPGQCAEWIDLGDLGWLDADGELFVIGRAADADALEAAQKISPVHEAEHLLRLEWDAADAAAVLMDAGPNGAAPEIWVATVDCPDADAETLAQMLRGRGYSCTVRIIPSISIPRGANGKIQRGELKRQLSVQAKT